MSFRSSLRFIAPALALCAAGVLLVPRSSRAFTVTGWSLGIDQRKVAVFDNFTDASANDNVVQHPNWPGFCGVELACWKAVTEWQSELFGDGTGDPLQTDGVGSGGANFDPAWAGSVTSAGGVNSNVISELQGSGGGVLAFTEFGSTGWRIRLYSDVQWDDGPGAPVPGAMDVQAVVTHEYGHALGLGHSSTGGATMAPAISGDGTSARSISADDQAGVQAIYGAKSASKPHIASVAFVAGDLVVAGTGFVAGSEVWMTRKTADPSPMLDVVSGLVPQFDGSLLVPALQDVGAVLVRVPGTSGAALSNSYPLGDAPGSVFVYCTPKVNSQGCVSAPSVVGTLSASAGSGGSVVCTNVLNRKFGLLFYGTSGPSAAPFGGGTLCVHGPIRRLPLQFTDGSPPPVVDCSGVLQDDVNQWIFAGNDPSLTAGAYVWFQGWSRDPGFAPPNNVGLSSGLRALIGP